MKKLLIVLLATITINLNAKENRQCEAITPIQMFENYKNDSVFVEFLYYKIEYELYLIKNSPKARANENKIFPYNIQFTNNIITGSRNGYSDMQNNLISNSILRNEEVDLFDSLAGCAKIFEIKLLENNYCLKLALQDNQFKNDFIKAALNSIFDQQWLNTNSQSLLYSKLQPLYQNYSEVTSYFFQPQVRSRLTWSEVGGCALDAFGHGALYSAVIGGTAGAIAMGQGATIAIAKEVAKKAFLAAASSVGVGIMLADFAICLLREAWD